MSQYSNESWKRLESSAIKVGIILVDEFSGPIKRINKAMRKIAGILSPAYRAGYYIENKRGRNKLVRRAK